MGEVIDITKILKSLGKAEQIGTKTGTVLSAEEAITTGMQAARKEMWLNKYGTATPPPVAPIDPKAINEIYRSVQTDALDSKPISVPPVKAKSMSQAMWEAAGWQDDHQLPASTVTPPGKAPASVVAHPASEEQVIAPSAIPDREALVKQEASQMDRYKLNESAYMAGSINYDQYLAEFLKIFPHE